MRMRYAVLHEILPRCTIKEVRQSAKMERNDDIRKERRHARRLIKENKFTEFMDVEKPGKFIKKLYQSSGKFKAAYSHARSEYNYYRYSDY